MEVFFAFHPGSKSRQRAEVGAPHIWQRRRPCRTRTTPGAPARRARCNGQMLRDRLGTNRPGEMSKSRKIAQDNLKK